MFSGQSNGVFCFALIASDNVQQRVFVYMVAYLRPEIAWMKCCILLVHPALMSAVLSQVGTTMHV